MRVDLHEHADDITVRVSAASLVRFVDNHANDVARIAAAFADIVLERLRRHVEDALALPELDSTRADRVAGEIAGTVPWQAADFVTRRLLLIDERTRRREEDDLAVRVPAEKVEDDDGSDERLAETRGKRAASTLLKSAFWTMLYW